jgi:hypothetical protein
VLAGAAIGHFLSAVIHDVFLGIPQAQRVRVMIQPSKDETTAYIVFSF